MKEKLTIELELESEVKSSLLEKSSRLGLTMENYLVDLIKNELSAPAKHNQTSSYLPFTLAGGDTHKKWTREEIYSDDDIKL